MKSHFKGLDALRAIAAFVVVIYHLEEIKAAKGFPNIAGRPGFMSSGAHLAVLLFFVLSGFLITYLLVKELDNTGGISFKKFYLRRIFRIWPLYYLVILLSWLLFDATYSSKTVLLCLGIFPNVAHALNIDWPTSQQIWSIGVEEQFYLVWPLVLTRIPGRKIVGCLVIFFIAFTALPYIIKYMNAMTLINEKLDIFTERFFYESKFNAMSMGGIFGYLYARDKRKLSFFYKSSIAYSAILLSFFLWFSGFKAPVLNDVIFSVLFAIMILNLSTNQNLKLNFENKAINFLGKISYGIYMYHWIVILLVLQFIPYRFFGNTIAYNLVVYTIVLITTVLVSHFSFISFERYFLKKKEKYEAKQS
jgi:peptidoglycan/LPS O-acetylase OafA/YrhL